MMHNSSTVEKNLSEQIFKALNIVLETGFGTIKIVIDKDRGIYDVIPSPRIRVKS